MDSANMTKMAPAANDMAIDTIDGSALESISKPIAVDTVPATTAIDHNPSICLRFLPLCNIPEEEAKPSGKLEMNIAAIKTIFTTPPVTRDIPRAIFSGMLSITEPTNNAKPVASLPPPPTLLCDFFLFFNSPLDLLFNRKLARVYEIPPNKNPNMTAINDCDCSNASSIKEKDKAAINTPLPNAIMEAIICLGKLTNIATTEPISNGILATNPKYSESIIE